MDKRLSSRHRREGQNSYVSAGLPGPGVSITAAGEATLSARETL